MPSPPPLFYYSFRHSCRQDGEVRGKKSLERFVSRRDIVRGCGVGREYSSLFPPLFCREPDRKTGRENIVGYSRVEKHHAPRQKSRSSAGDVRCQIPGVKCQMRESPPLSHPHPQTLDIPSSAAALTLSVVPILRSVTRETIRAATQTSQDSFAKDHKFLIFRFPVPDRDHHTTLFTAPEPGRQRGAFRPMTAHAWGMWSRSPGGVVAKHRGREGREGEE